MLDPHNESRSAGSEPRSDSPAPDALAEPVADEAWSGDEIEEAYQKALAALEDVPWEPESVQLPAGQALPLPDAGPAAVPEEVPRDSTSDAVESAANPSSGDAFATPGPRLALQAEPHSSAAGEEQVQVNPAQVIEAALFVGGGPITAKKFSSFLRGSADPEEVERIIAGLNDQYVAEARPYEIRPGDGGYRLELRPEYEKLRQRAYGSGPREVKLSQDVLEVLALVAYQQPIAQEQIEAHGKPNAGGLLRQLLRRDLVSLQRGEGGRKDVKYCTTPRFLAVFGLGSLDELPQPDDLTRK